MDVIWLIGLAFAGGYCLLRCLLDLREKRYLWAAVGALAMLALWLTPIPSHAVKIDLTVPGPSEKR